MGIEFGVDLVKVDTNPAGPFISRMGAYDWPVCKVLVNNTWLVTHPNSLAQLMRYRGGGLEWNIWSPHGLPLSRLKGVNRTFFPLKPDCRHVSGQFSSLTQALPSTMNHANWAIRSDHFSSRNPDEDAYRHTARLIAITARI